MTKAIVDLDNKSTIDSTKILSKDMAKLIGKRVLVGVLVTVAVTVISTVVLGQIETKINPMDSTPES